MVGTLRGWVVGTLKPSILFELFALTGGWDAKISPLWPLAPRSHLVKVSQHLICVLFDFPKFHEI